MSTVRLSTGGAEYNLTDAAVDINDLIDGLEEARDEGATHVVMPSGNRRGAQWIKLYVGCEWIDE